MIFQYTSFREYFIEEIMIVFQEAQGINEWMAPKDLVLFGYFSYLFQQRVPLDLIVFPHQEPRVQSSQSWVVAQVKADQAIQTPEGTRSYWLEFAEATEVELS